MYNNIGFCWKWSEVRANIRDRQAPSQQVLAMHTANEDLVTESYAVVSLKILAKERYVDEW